MTTTEFIRLNSSEAQKALNAMNATELVAFFNKLTKGDVKRFKDRATGVKEIWAARKGLVAKLQVPSVPESMTGRLSSKPGTQNIPQPKPEVRIPQPQPEIQPPSTIAIVSEKGRSLGGTPSMVTPFVSGVKFVWKKQRYALYFANPVGSKMFEQYCLEQSELSEIETTSYGEANPDEQDKFDEEYARRKGDEKRVSKEDPPLVKPATVSKPTRKEHDVHAVIRLKSNLNPKKAGTKAFDRFELYEDGMTVAQAMAAGVTREDLRWDSVHGHIELVASP